jgi:hypothetical protein
MGNRSAGPEKTFYLVSNPGFPVRLTSKKANERCGTAGGTNPQKRVVPTVLNELLTDEDPAKSERVMKAMLEMTKLDIATLKKAAAGDGQSAVSGGR